VLAPAAAPAAAAAAGALSALTAAAAAAAVCVLVLPLLVLASGAEGSSLAVCSKQSKACSRKHPAHLRLVLSRCMMRCDSSQAVSQELHNTVTG
jgi:hypothetical protein